MELYRQVTYIMIICVDIVMHSYINCQCSPIPTLFYKVPKMSADRPKPFSLSQCITYVMMHIHICICICL